MHEGVDGRLHIGLGAAQLRVERTTVREVVDGHAEHVAGLQVVAEPDVRLDLGHARSATRAAACDLDAVLDGADQLWDLEQRKAAREAILQRFEEQLLARVAVEVRVRVPEAHEVERLLAVQPLVPGMQVDRGVAARSALRVDVAVIDVDIHAVQFVHDELEAVEIERDQIVDRDAGQLLDGVERALRAASRPRRIDSVTRISRRRVAVDRDDEVAREREQRERVILRVGPDQHQRVGARVLRAEAAGAGALVVADDERGCRFRRRRHAREVFLRLLHRR